MIKVCRTTDVADGEIRGFDVAGTKIALINLGGEFFAVNDICTHEHCKMDGGFVEDKNIVCPCHGSAFDLKTGAVKNLPATEPLKVYEVKMDKGEVFVNL